MKIVRARTKVLEKQDVWSLKDVEICWFVFWCVWSASPCTLPFVLILNFHITKQTLWFFFCQRDVAIVTHPSSVFWKTRLYTHAHTQSPGSSLFVNVPCLLWPHRKSNWIADRMKKLIKPKGGREGRAHFTAAGSVENLADSTEFTSDTHTANPGKAARTHTHTHSSRVGFTKTCSFSNHQAGLQACIQIIWWQSGQHWCHSLPPQSSTWLSLQTTCWREKAWFSFYAHCDQI